MKKFTALLLSLLMVVSLAACDGSDTSAVSTETSTASVEAGETDANAEAEPVSADIKVGFIFLHDENSTYDLNFINAAKEVCAKYGIEPIIKTNIPEGQECQDAAEELADAGCSIVFADSFGHEDYMIEAAKEYPDVQFAHATGTKAHTEGLPNYHNGFASIYDGRYLAGIAAGLKLQEMIDAGQITPEEAKIGYVGAFTYAEVMSGYTAFFLGARSVVPTATMEVTFTGSWYDETAEKEGAQKLIDNGCVLISQHADSMGAPTACETAGVPNVSYNGSTESVAPNTFIVSSRINWVPYMDLLIDSVINGKEIPADYTGTIATGSVELTTLGSAAAAGTEEAIKAAQAEIEAGNLHVFDLSTFTVGGETLTSFLADVDSDADYEHETEVVVDGYIAESAFRSAPYFDLRIDGITLLDEQY